MHTTARSCQAPAVPSAPPAADSDAGRKLRGGYYTPPALADFLCEWAIRNSSARVLEPSCGDGEVLGAAAARLLALGCPPEQASHQLTGVELFASEAEAARDRLSGLGLPVNGSVRGGDLFAAMRGLCGGEAFTEKLRLDPRPETAGPLAGERYDAAVGNPPFLRYQTFPEPQRDVAFEIMRSAGLRPNRLTNAWVPFLVAAALALKPTGRLAMVIPAELLQVKYAAETRRFLTRYFRSVTLVAFRRLVFRDIQQEVVLLLADRGGKARGIDLIELEDERGLDDLRATPVRPREPKPVDHATDKWLMYLLDRRQIDLLRAVRARPDIGTFGDVAEVDVGVVTGRNAFFVLDREAVEADSLWEYVTPLAGRTAQLPGLEYLPEEWAAQADAGGRSYLLTLTRDDEFNRLPAGVRRRIAAGEAADMHTGYKCRTRTPWYAVPRAWVPDAFMFRQIYAYPKTVVNLAGATATDTVHRVRVRPDVCPRRIAAAALNVATFAVTEVAGRSYGGGVLEIEPNEAERVPLPLPPASAVDFDALDALERRSDVGAVLDRTDRLLADHYGFDRRDLADLRTIWRRLSDRRIGRGVRSGGAGRKTGRTKAAGGRG